MENLMAFLIVYARKVHNDRYFVNMLVNNPGHSYLDILTPSDIAYTATVLQNSGKVWMEKANNDGKVMDKTITYQFTSGEGKKRMLGQSMWSDEGLAYYERALVNWKPCFRKNSPEYKYLREYWHNWIEGKGKDLIINGDTMSKKSIYDVLHTRKKGEDTRKYAAARKKGNDDVPKKKYSYETDSDDEVIDLGGWKTKKANNKEKEKDQESADEESSVDEEEDGVPLVGSSSDEDEEEEIDDDADNDKDRSKIGKGSQKKGTNNGGKMMDRRSMTTLACARAERGINKDYDNEDVEDEDDGDEDSASQVSMPLSKKGGKGGRSQRKQAANGPVKKARVSGRGATMLVAAAAAAAEPKRKRTKSTKYGD
jgi:hypothetical protein